MPGGLVWRGNRLLNRGALRHSGPQMKAHFPPPSRLRLSRRAQAGFSLVELLIAAAILAVTVSGFYLTFGGANELATKSRLNTSAKILLGAAVNEALSSRWSANFTPEVAQVTTDAQGALFDTKNEGQNARPVARPANPLTGTNRGVVNFFTAPNEDSVVVGEMRRFTSEYTEPGGRIRTDMRIVKFRVKYTYKGVDSPWLEINTVITRD